MQLQTKFWNRRRREIRKDMMELRNEGEKQNRDTRDVIEPENEIEKQDRDRRNVMEPGTKKRNRIG